MADPPLSPTSPRSEPLPIAIIGMYVEIHTPFHTFISIEEISSYCFFPFPHSHKNKTQNKKKITKSIGAGIAGLALAIGLHNNHNNSQEKKKKIPFILYEEASEFSAVGYVLDNDE